MRNARQQTRPSPRRREDGAEVAQGKSLRRSVIGAALAAALVICVAVMGGFDGAFAEEPVVEPELTSATLQYRDSTMEEFAAFESTALTPLSISARGGSLAFDVLLTYSDGQTAFASASNVGVTWAFAGEVSEQIATLEVAEGIATVTARGSGDGTARLRADLTDYPDILIAPFKSENSNAAITISGNDETVVPQVMSLYYQDWTTVSGWDAYDESQLPLIVLLNGQETDVNFKAQILWSDGSGRDVGTDSYVATWSVDSCTDLDGNPCGTFASIDADGHLTANEDSSGYVSITCVATSPDYPDNAFTSTAKVEVRNNHRYVKELRIVDATYEQCGSGLELEEGINQLQFYAQVTWSTYSTEERRQIDYIEYSGDSTIPGLTWNVYRGDTTDVEQYSVVNDKGIFTALSGFAAGRLEARIVGGGYFGQDITNNLRITREINEDEIGHSNSINVKIYHISDYSKLKDQAPIAREVNVTREQMETLGSPYSDWFTFRKKSDAWGTVYTYGVSITSFLNMLGIDASDLEYMDFVGSDGYSAINGFYSAETILSTQYRYSNFYMNKVSSSASYLGQGNVAPMIALNWYMDSGNDYDGAKFAKMTDNTTMRFVMGMSGVEGRNAARFVQCINQISVIIADQPDDDGGGGGGGGGTGGGTGGSTGGGTGGNEGQATYGSSGGEGAGGTMDGAAGRGGTGSILRELLEESQRVIERATLDNPWVFGAVALSLLSLVVGAYYTARKYRFQIADGNRLRREQ